MSIPKIEGSQRDFSAGELDATLKRADDNPIMKVGARQMVNWRILNTRAVSNRPGRTVLFLESGRIEQIRMAPNQLFYIVFGQGYLRVYNAAGVNVFGTSIRGDSTPIQWTLATVQNIVWDIYQTSIYITYADNLPDNRPQVLTWDGVSQNSNWSIAGYIPATFYGYQLRTIFYRLSTKGITIWPSASTGSGVVVSASAPVFTTAWVGRRIRFANQQMVVASFTDSQHITVNIAGNLPYLMQLSWTGSPGVFAVGQLVSGTVSSAEGEIVAIDATHIYVLLINSRTFLSSDVIVSSAGASSAGASSITTAFVAYNSITTNGTEIWDDEVMSNLVGWPISCFVDQGRLGLCNFPTLPGLIAWSANGNFTDQYTDSDNATPTNAIQELAPGKSQVLYVKSGMEGSEFVFCDNAVYYIPINVNDPLQPGSVAFNKLSDRGSAQVQPRAAEQSLIYVKAGGVEIGAVQALGATNRPYLVDTISQYHSHLFTTFPPTAIAIPEGSAQFEELYIYVLRSDDNIVVGRYSMKSGMIEFSSDGKPTVGWSLWSGAGSATWISALQNDVIFSSVYTSNGSSFVVERLDVTQYLDAAVSVNNLPASLAPPAGKGPLWFVTTPTVTLMDGLRMMGTYQVDANGNIIPQNNGGENLLSSTLTAGQPWNAILEPFAPIAQSGQSVKQRLRKRRSSWFAAYVSSSTGFLFARLFAGSLYPGGPALGTIMNNYRVTTWNQGDDPTQPPPLREQVYSWRPLGKDYDVRRAIIKDTPGPLVIEEVAMEVSV